MSPLTRICPDPRCALNTNVISETLAPCSISADECVEFYDGQFVERPKWTYVEFIEVACEEGHRFRGPVKAIFPSVAEGSEAIPG